MTKAEAILKMGTDGRSNIIHYERCEGRAVVKPTAWPGLVLVTLQDDSRLLARFDPKRVRYTHVREPV